MSVDTIGNFLTSIRNAVAVSKRSVKVPYSKLREDITRVLSDEGYIKGYAHKSDAPGKDYIEIELKYVNGESVIHELKRISKPGRRFYTKSGDVPSVIGGLGVAILTTNLGVVSDRTARAQSVGGEVMCSVW